MKDLDSRYLPGAGKTDDARHFTNYTKRSQVATTPLSVDMAREMRDELAKVRSILTRVSPLSEDAPIEEDEIEY